MQRTRRFFCVIAILAIVTRVSASSPIAPFLFSDLAQGRQGQSLTAKEIYSKCRDSILQIECEAKAEGQSKTEVYIGTGFIFLSKDIVVTAAHVIEGAKSIKVMDRQKMQYPVSQVNYNKLHDIAVLKLEKPTLLPPLQPKAFKDVTVGETAFAIGNPLGLLPDSITQGIVSGKRDLDGIPFAQISTPVSQGNSGGPVLDDYGRVFAVVSFGLTEGQSLNLASAIDYATMQAQSSSGWTPAPEFLNSSSRSPRASSKLGDALPVEHPASKKVEVVMLGDFAFTSFEPKQIDVSPDGSTVVLVKGNRVALYSITSKKVVTDQTLDSDIQFVLMISNSKLALSTTDGVIYLIEYPTWNIESKTEFNKETAAPIIGKDGKFLYFTSPSTNFRGLDDLYRMDLWTKSIRLLARDFCASSNYCVSPSGQYVAGWQPTKIDSETYYSIGFLNLKTGLSSDTTRDRETINPIVMPTSFIFKGETLNYFCSPGGFLDDDNSFIVCGYVTSKKLAGVALLMIVFNVKNTLVKRQKDFQDGDYLHAYMMESSETLIAHTTNGVTFIDIPSGEVAFRIKSNIAQLCFSTSQNIICYYDGQRYAVFRFDKKK